MKIVFSLENGKMLSNLVDEDYVLKENETFQKPEDGIYQPFSFKNGVITGATKEEFENTVQLQSSNGPKSGNELVADLAQQLASTQIAQTKVNAQLIQQNAMLVKQLADLQSEKETNNG